MHNDNATPISSGQFEFSILKTPNSKFIFVGSVPVELLIKCKNKLGQDDYKSPIFETYEEAEQQLKTFFENNPQ